MLLMGFLMVAVVVMSLYWGYLLIVGSLVDHVRIPEEELGGEGKYMGLAG